MKIVFYAIYFQKMSTSNKYDLLNTLSNDELEGNIKNILKKDYCTYIVCLRNKQEELESYCIISKHVEFLERNLINNMQYNRRESIEISGLEKVNNNDLEKTTVGILEDIGIRKIDFGKFKLAIDSRIQKLLLLNL